MYIAVAALFNRLRLLSWVQWRSQGGRDYSVLVNYQSPLSSFLRLAPLIISFSIKYRRNRLLLESFIELPVKDVRIYQLVNKRLEILAIATSHIAHLCNKYNHVFAPLISMPGFNSINFHQIIGLKLSSKIQSF